MNAGEEASPPDHLAAAVQAALYHFPSHANWGGATGAWDAVSGRAARGNCMPVVCVRQVPCHCETLAHISQLSEVL